MLSKFSKSFLKPLLKHFFNIRNAYLIFLIFLTGCGQQALYTSVKEKEANEMLSILISNDISCEKVMGIEEAWNVTVEESEFAEAVKILNEAGYPKENFTSMGEVFKKSGLVSSPLEERVRFIHALSENLSETLTHINGVVTARVHIVLPDNDPYSEKFLPSSASVFITYLPRTNVEEFVKDIKFLVKNSIEGLTYDKVSVTLFPTATVQDKLDFTSNNENEFTRILSVKIASDSITQFWIIIGSICLIFLLIMIISALFMWHHVKENKNDEVES